MPSRFVHETPTEPTKYLIGVILSQLRWLKTQEEQEEKRVRDRPEAGNGEH